MENTIKKIKFGIITTLPLRQSMTEPDYNLLSTGNILGLNWKSFIVNDDNGDELFAISFKGIRGLVYFQYFGQMENWLSDMEFQQSITDIKNEINKIK